MLHTLLKLVGCVALSTVLRGQAQPRPEGHESPADLARRANERGGDAGKSR